MYPESFLSWTKRPSSANQAYGPDCQSEAPYLAWLFPVDQVALLDPHLSFI